MKNPPRNFLKYNKEACFELISINFMYFIIVQREIISIIFSKSNKPIDPFS